MSINFKAIKRFTLNKGERVKKRKDIEQLFREAPSFAVPPLRVFYLLGKRDEKDSGAPFVLFGCGVSKKQFKRAVDRNRIKRLLREGYRLQKLPLQEAMIANGEQHLKVFVLFTGKELPAYDLIKGRMAAVLKQLEQKSTG